MNTIEKLKEQFQARITIDAHSPQRYYVTVAGKDVRDVARYLFKELGARLSTCTAVDTRAGFEVLYHFSLDKEGLLCTIKALAPRENPTLDSICDFLPGAEWIELEMNELMGVNFAGNPRVRPFLLSDDFPAGVYPLRKKPESDLQHD
ncbi:MAG: NADH-quinone oxidoreductase subunit C [Candidatus Margulisiibacteriota bacterium]